MLIMEYIHEYNIIKMITICTDNTFFAYAIDKTLKICSFENGNIIKETKSTK
jgi:hypothetical protein